MSFRFQKINQRCSIDQSKVSVIFGGRDKVMTVWKEQKTGGVVKNTTPVAGKTGMGVEPPRGVDSVHYVKSKPPSH